MTAIDNGTIDYKNEIVRKSIHLCSLSIPIVYYFISRELALWILIPVTFFSLTIDLGRYFFISLNKIVNKYFGFLLRDHEKDAKKKNLNGATYVFISALIGIIIFPKVIFITAFAVLIISDISAALFGRRFGKHKFLSKSFEGTLAFIISGCIVILFTPKVDHSLTEYLIGFFAVFVGGIIENISYGWADDNLTIPISIGITMLILFKILLPNVSLILHGVPI